jgi:hypothetical protein
MGGIVSAIIIPPAGSGVERAAPGSPGAEAFRRVAAVQAIAPRRGHTPHRQAGFHPDDTDRGRGRDNREVRQLAIRPDYRNSAIVRPDRAASRGLAGELAADRTGHHDFGPAPFASIQFLAQVIGQAEEPSSGPLAYHPDGAALGSDAYRRAGATPPHYSEQPAFFRVAI